MYVLDSVFEKASFPFELATNKDEKDLEAFHEFVSNLDPDDFLSE